MSSPELAERTRSSGVPRLLYGWGRTASSSARVIRAGSAEEVVEVLAGQTPASTGVIARGAGRSYGDAAQNDGGDVLDMTGLSRICSIDPEQRLITAQAGATMAQLMDALARHDLTLPVVPGTRHVTLGGAIASDVHGKNHHRDGGLARHVLALTLCTPTGACLELSPEDDPELFYATLGGMGLTGVVVQATLRAETRPTPWVAANVDRTDGIEQTLALMGGEEHHRYSVAWLDLLAGGARLGRAVVSRADPWPTDDDAPSTRRSLRNVWGRRRHNASSDALSQPPALEVPRGFPATLLRPSSMRAFNALRWHAAPRRERGRALELAPYLFPLDGLGEWNRLYGPTGLVQYQFVVPSGAETTIVRCLELLRARRLPVYLAVFKRLGAQFGGPLSFPLEGWTLAIDLPAAAPGLRPALDELDGLVADCGGRVYLTKDVRLRRELLGTMYPQLDRFRSLRARVDPEEVLRSDLAQRLGLCETAR
jgi:decaprenylphospho-beta-D-ribofuranose 2-oxidase